MREKTFPAGAVADRQGFPLPPSQIQTVTSLYGGITAFGNYDGRKWTAATGKSWQVAGLGPIPLRGPKTFFPKWSCELLPVLYVELQSTLLHTQVTCLCFYFTAGEHVQKKKESSLSVLPSSASLSLTHSLNLFGEHRSCVNEANEQVVGAHITQEHELRETLDTMARTWSKPLRLCFLF